MGRSIRWQALLAGLGIVLLAAILASTAREFTSLTVPAQGGVYTEAVVGSPRAINPLLSFSSDLDRDLTGLIFQGLVALNERGEPVPALAESWEISPDEKEITFSLRRDVRWHDGAPFSAADVVFTVGVLQSDAFAESGQPASIFLSQLWRNVSVEQVDSHTVRFRLQQPLASFLAETTIGILPSHLWNNVPIAELSQSLLNLQPVGTGPWRLADLTALSARLEPNPYANGPAPFLEAIEFRFFPDYASAFAAFQAGEVDGVSRVLPQDIAAAQASEDMVVLTAPLAGSTLVYLNLDNPDVPFLADTQVRQALYLALDQSKLIDRALNGQGIPADGPFMSGAWAHAPGQRSASDPERAAEILAAAGWTDSNRDGVRDREGVDLAFDLLGDNEALLQDLAEQWRQVGVLAQPRLVNLASLAADYLSPRTFQAAVTHWQLSGDPDPYPLWHSTQSDNGQNYTGWSNEQADLLLEQGRSVNDPGRRIQLYSEFQRIFAEELPALPLTNDVYAYGISSQVKDVEIGRLNWPWERFRSAHQWYIVTQRVTVEAEE
ncbi:MAG TPA: peptide ABC transporter substrate-binding protein [Anaerolineae bacterium]|nr:peptide ABC transporter substrate-binding protein [Anaerolineae bacterium]